MGDELQVTGQARLLQLRDPRPVAVRARDGGARWHPLFDGNPRLSRDGVGAQWLENWPGHRPYIASFDDRRYIWRAFECPPGEIYFTADELAAGEAGAGKIVIEPNILAKASPNKDWGFERWQAVVRLRPELPWLQLGPWHSRRLAGVRQLATRDFRTGAAVIAQASAYVGPEGGLHHAAAAVGTPAVVLFGGFISPAQTGYATHRNLFTGGEPCGQRRPCGHCRKALAEITPEMVIAELEAISRETMARPVPARPRRASRRVDDEGEPADRREAILPVQKTASRAQLGS